MTATNIRPQRNPVPSPRQVSRLTDADIIEIIEPVYEYAVWASDLRMVDFDTFAELSRVIAELRERRDAA